MPIRAGEHPENDPEESRGLNKFIGFAFEGHRGRVIALSGDGLEALVVAVTQSMDPEDGIQVGRVYRVREESPGEWPRAVEEAAPEADGGWTSIIMALTNATRGGSPRESWRNQAVTALHACRDALRDHQQYGEEGDLEHEAYQAAGAALDAVAREPDWQAAYQAVTAYGEDRWGDDYWPASDKVAAPKLVRAGVMDASDLPMMDCPICGGLGTGSQGIGNCPTCLGEGELDGPSFMDALHGEEE